MGLIKKGYLDCISCMRIALFLLGLTLHFWGFSQQKSGDELEQKVKQLHVALVNKDYAYIEQQTDKALSYGHSNGWVQTQGDVINDFKNGVISYQKFSEDSVTVNIHGDAANVRFVADVEATVRGNAGKFHLKVLEVWVKRGREWKLFGRQAVRG